MGRDDYLRTRLENIKHLFFQRQTDLVQLLPEDLNPDMQRRLTKVRTALLNSRSRYRPDYRLKCNLLLLKTATPITWPGWRTDSLYGWREFVSGNIETEMLPGTHLNFFQSQNCVSMAEAIATRMANG